MIQKIYETNKGRIVYYLSKQIDNRKNTLVFLPGLSADHTLFDKQVEYFNGKYNLFAWDAPMHASSVPFESDFSLKDKATWLLEILKKENLENIIMVGQSMGGYVGQTFCQFYSNEIKGFISIDSAPLARSYVSKFDIWLMRHIEPIYKLYPWKVLKKAGANGTASTPYGRELMTKIMSAYDENPSRYVKLVGHGYRMLADAYDANLEYQIPCPALLLCGEKDRAGLTKNYNKKWNKKTGIPLVWIKGAGHNSNTDNPTQVNEIIEKFVIENFSQN